MSRGLSGSDTPGVRTKESSTPAGVPEKPRRSAFWHPQNSEAPNHASEPGRGGALIKPHRGQERVRFEVAGSRASREVVGLLVKMELKDVMVRFTNGCEE